MKPQRHTVAIHPVARGVATLFGMIGALLAREPISLLIVWIGVLIPLCLMTGIYRKHARVVGGVVLPFFLALSEFMYNKRMICDKQVGIPGIGLHRRLRVDCGLVLFADSSIR